MSNDAHDNETVETPVTAEEAKRYGIPPASEVPEAAEDSETSQAD